MRVNFLPEAWLLMLYACGRATPRGQRGTPFDEDADLSERLLELSSWRAPLLGHPAERAKVPGRYEEIAIEVAGRDRLVKRRDESFKDLIKVLREWIRDLRRVMKSCSSDIRKDVWPTGFHIGVGAHLNPAVSMTAPGEPPKAKNGSSGGFLAFWTTLPGILTGVAALITAIVGLATLVHSWTGTSQNAAPLQTSATATNSASATSESTSSGQQATGTVENGRLALRRGDAADLEHGQVGFSATEDIMFGPETTPSLHAAGTAFLAPIQTMPSKPTCRRALSGQRDTAEAIPDLSAPWICVSTTEGHVASVEILQAPGVGSAELELKYSVWY